MGHVMFKNDEVEVNRWIMQVKNNEVQVSRWTMQVRVNTLRQMTRCAASPVVHLPTLFDSYEEVEQVADQIQIYSTAIDKIFSQFDSYEEVIISKFNGKNILQIDSTISQEEAAKQQWGERASYEWRGFHFHRH